MIVPTVERVESLRNCLNCLLKQKYPVYEIIVVFYEKDLSTVEFLKEFPMVRKLKVSRLGAVLAYNTGKEAATGDIISHIDDDTRPGEMWAQKISDYFVKMPALQGLGGRDRVFFPDGKSVSSPMQDEVGVVKWYGKYIGNHHLGQGEARSVDFLKGCNMSFRASFISDIKFDERLLGNASQIGLELDFCLQVKSKGGLLIYDPKVELDHYVVARSKADFDQREFRYIGYRNVLYNTNFAIKKNLGFLMFIGFALHTLIREVVRLDRPHRFKRIYAAIWAFFWIFFKRNSQ